MTVSPRPPLAALALALALAGCTLGPKYAPPTPPAPASGAFASTPNTVAPAEQPPANWWRLYDTPALDALVAEALQHNKDLLEAAANLREARAALSLARSARYPSTSFSAGSQYGVDSFQAFAASLLKTGPASPSGYYTLGLDASYELDLFGRVHRAVQAAAANFQAVRAAEDAVRVSVAGETARAYLNACAYKEEYESAAQSLNVANETYEITQKQAQFGAASDFDLARARQAVEQAKADLPGFEGQRRTALFELAVLTGRPPEEVSKDAAACTAPPKLSRLLPVGDVQGLFRRRPDVREAERQLASNVARIGVAMGDLYPVISIGGSSASAAGTLGGLGALKNLTYGIGPMLSWTFPNTAAARAEVHEAEATASASYANFQGTVLQALQDVETAITAYGDELDRNRSLTAARDQSALALKLARVQLSAGSASFLDVLTAQANFITATAALSASDEAVASDQVTLFKALGGGWEQAPEPTPIPITDRRTGKTIKIP